MDKKIKKLKLDQDISNKIHLYFEGDLDNITKEKLSAVYNNPELKKELELTPEDVKKFKSIIKKSKDPKFRIIVLDPTIEIKSIPDVVEESEKKIINYEDIKSEDINKYILDSRKAFINWINEEFYPNIILNKDENLKIYQQFAKSYLALDTPYRGLLIFHGLGTGKTATAITSTEGLSTQMNITTLLPASLETEFINEVKKWGNDFFKIDNNNWKFYTKQEIIDNKEIKENLYKNFHISIEDIDKISIRAKNKTKIKKEGLWLVENNKDYINEIKTISGYYIENNKQTNIKLEKEQIFSEPDKIFIDIQITYLISLKYNFIHYNPFPKVKSTKLKEFLYTDDIDDEFIKYNDERKTYNQKIVDKLTKKLDKNKRELNINSPFNNEVIIIDEVHNFVREIINKSETAITFYNWIMNGVDIKLVFLSGTPIINKPSEIAYLFNMLRGTLKIYNFTIKTTINDISDIEDKLKDIFYKNNSSIQQFNIVKQKGKIIISILKNNTSFQSILDTEDNIIYSIKYNNHTFEQFIKEIYNGLHLLFSKESIMPSEKDFNKLSNLEKTQIIKGKEKVFDEEINVIFNKYVSLFTVFEEDRELDLSDTEQFLNYFLNEDRTTIPTNKRILLKRMISGLVSYYPIDRLSITTMPEIILPNNTLYSNYNIAEKINIVICPMSFKQFEKYETSYSNEKERAINRKKRKMYSDDNFDYHIRTRQACNMIYNDDNFRKLSQKNPEYKIKKEEEYEKLTNSSSLVGQNISLYSPKFYEIIKNINKFVESDIPTGKILFYSEFRGDAGSEIFEQILKANGYSKYSPDTFDNKKSKRYTFITGQEKKDDRKRNKEKYNEDNNIFGEYIQIMIISGAGAEGISLFGVRQVHILEPYWNYIRIDQVFGRAIRLRSHIKLPKDKQNVEQYLYLSVFPKGNDILSVYKTLLELDTWNVPDLTTKTDQEITDLLISEYKSIYTIIQNIIKIKLETRSETADEYLFNIMEKKYNISNEIMDIIKEASVDCIQNTRDNPILNENCIRYNQKLISENSYFPGISSNKLNDIDNKQLSAIFSFFIKPNIIVLSAQEKDESIYVYYKLNDIKYKDDIRYIKDNSQIIGKIYPKYKLFYLYILNNHKLNNQLGNKFSVFQEIYKLDNAIIDDMNKNTSQIFYDINILSQKENLIGYKIKYNINETFYYSPNTPIIRLYPFDIMFDNNFNISGLTPFIINKTNSYKKL
tara:strand:- start:97 stop:3753 length:3657 start_codon:yes stop_codon:yes gene_type:complete